MCLVSMSTVVHTFHHNEDERQKEEVVLLLDAPIMVFPIYYFGSVNKLVLLEYSCMLRSTVTWHQCCVWYTLVWSMAGLRLLILYELWLWRQGDWIQEVADNNPIGGHPPTGSITGSPTSSIPCQNRQSREGSKWANDKEVKMPCDWEIHRE